MTKYSGVIVRFVYLIEMEPPNIPNLITYSYVCLLLLNVLFDALASLLMKDVYTAFAIPVNELALPANVVRVC